jgi:hypothetical protein
MPANHSPDAEMVPWAVVRRAARGYCLLNREILANAAHSESHQARISAIVVRGGPVVLQLCTGVVRPEDWGKWDEPKALAAPADSSAGQT